MILDKIISSTLNRVAEAKKVLPINELKMQIYDGDEVQSFHHRSDFLFEKALSNKNVTDAARSTFANNNVKHRETGNEIAFICEVKKASPSKGIIAEEFPYLEVALEYERAGAAAISVLTEPEYFMGCNQYLTEISKSVEVPVLRKDFIVDEYQIYEAKFIGADAVLLICSILATDILKQYIRICDGLGLSALVEAHSEEEVESALEAGARIIGVNNRNLQTFEVDLNNSVRLRSLVPKDILFVAESGIKTSKDMAVLRKAGVNAVLIGETMMRSPNKKEILHSLRR